MAAPSQSVRKFTAEMEKSINILSDRLSDTHLRGNAGTEESLRALIILKNNVGRSTALCLEIEQLEREAFDQKQVASNSAKQAKLELEAIEKSRKELKKNFDKDMKCQLEAVEQSRDALKTSCEEINSSRNTIKAARLSLQQAHDAKVAPQLEALQKGISQLKADQQQLESQKRWFEQTKKDSSSLQSLDETLKGHTECSSKERVAEITTKLANSEYEAKQNQTDAAEWKHKHDLLEQQVASLKEAAACHEKIRVSRDELLLSNKRLNCQLVAVHQRLEPLEKSLSDQRELLSSRQLLHSQEIQSMSDQQVVAKNAFEDQTTRLFGVLYEIAETADAEHQQQVRTTSSIEYGVRIQFDYLEKKRLDAEAEVQTSQAVVQGLQRDLLAAHDLFSSTSKDVLSLFEIDTSCLRLAETIEPKIQELRETLSAAQQSNKVLKEEENIVLALLANEDVIFDVTQSFSEVIRAQVESIREKLRDTQQRCDDLEGQKNSLLSYLNANETTSLLETVRQSIEPLEQELESTSEEVQGLKVERKAVLDLFDIDATHSTLSQIIQPELQRIRDELSALTREKQNSLALFDIDDQATGLVQTIRPKLQLLHAVSSELANLVQEKQKSLTLFDITDQTKSLVDTIKPKLQQLDVVQSSLSILVEEKRESLVLFGIKEDTNLLDTIRPRLEELNRANTTVENFARDKRTSLALFDTTDQTASLAETIQSKLQLFRDNAEGMEVRLSTFQDEQKTVLDLVGADIDQPFIDTVRAKVQSLETLRSLYDLLKEEKKQSLGLFGVDDQSSDLFKTISTTMMPLQLKLSQTSELQTEQKQLFQLFNVQPESDNPVEKVKDKIKLLEQEKMDAVAEVTRLLGVISSLKHPKSIVPDKPTSSMSTDKFQVDTEATSAYTNDDGSKRQRIHQISPLVKQHVVSANEWIAVCDRENRLYQKLVMVSGTDAYLARQQAASLLGRDSRSFEKLEAYLHQKPTSRKNYQCMLSIAAEGHRGQMPVSNDEQCTSCSSQKFEFCPQIRAKSGSTSLSDYRIVSRPKTGSGIPFPFKPS